MISPPHLGQPVPLLMMLRARVSLRLLQDSELPAFKGAMLRGGFGYAFQRSACAPPCWTDPTSCPVRDHCAYQRIFEPRHPQTTTQLHDLRDIPRPFVIEPPLPPRTTYQAGDSLEFGLVLVGSAIDDLTHFIDSFSRLGRMGLGRYQAQAQLERIEILHPWRPTGVVVYQDGTAQQSKLGLPTYSRDLIVQRAAALPPDLRVELLTPLRITARGDILRAFDLAETLRSIGWRVRALATFFGDDQADYDYRSLVERARSLTVEQDATRWVDWERSSTRTTQSRPMNLGGIIGSVVLRDVPVELRALLLAGTLIHAGKACVFGNGQLELKPLR